MEKQISCFIIYLSVYYACVGKAEETRQMIIEKTASIFNKKGYSGTFLSDITRVTGLSKGSIYGNFENKDEVAVQALKYNIALITRSFENERTTASSTIDLLLSYPRAYKKIYKEIIGNGGCPVVNTLTDADDTHAELVKIAILMIRRWKRDIARTIARGKQENEIRSSVDENKIADLMISLIEGGSMLTKSTGQESFIKNAIDHVESLIEGIKV